MHTLFVYGTLKHGYGNYERLLYNARFLGEAVSVNKNFVLEDCGVPFLIENDDARETRIGRVKGELFEINDEHLRRCDRLEGHPDNYCREQRQFWLTGEGTPREAWVYLWKRGWRSFGRVIQPHDGILEWSR